MAWLALPKLQKAKPKQEQQHNNNNNSSKPQKYIRKFLEQTGSKEDSKEDIEVSLINYKDMNQQNCGSGKWSFLLKTQVEDAYKSLKENSICMVMQRQIPKFYLL